MSARKRIDPARYRKLVSKVSPMLIETEGDNERALAIIERLLKKGDRRGPEEDAILNLLTHLVERFEEKAYPVGESTPRETLSFLLEQRGLRPAALGEVLGSRGRVSEVLSGKRSISKEQAKRLGEFFNISAGAFI